MCHLYHQEIVPDPAVNVYVLNPPELDQEKVNPPPMELRFASVLGYLTITTPDAPEPGTQESPQPPPPDPVLTVPGVPG
jgi:hypothetical protein